ncbi:peptidylprolyl isomerase [bacterium]|nr:peptidylprolyl isomerase [bacterium]
MRARCWSSAFLAPGAAFLLAFALCVLAIGGVAGQAPSGEHPVLESLYRGDPDRILARTPWGDLSEQGLFHFRLMQGKRDPDLFHLYEMTPSGPARAALRERVVKAIQEWALTLGLAAEVGDWEPVERLEQLQLRLLLHPIHELIWVDLRIAPQVLIAYEDVLKYYVENPEDFPSPRPVRLRYIFLPVDEEGASSETLAARREEALREMNRIQDEVLIGEKTFAEAAQAYSGAANAEEGGLTEEFEKDEWFPEFEKQAVGLGPDLFSSVFFGPDGVYWLQGEDAGPRTVLPLHRVEGRIHEILYFKQLQRRYELEVRNLRKYRRIVNRSAEVDLVRASTPVIRVGDFMVREKRMWDLFPSLIRSGFQTNIPGVQAVSRLVIERELIAQNNEKRGLDSDLRMMPAVEMARTIRKAERRLQEILGPKFLMDRSQILDCLKAYPSYLEHLTGSRACLIQARILHSEGMAEVNRRHRMVQLEGKALEIQERYSSMTLEQAAWLRGPTQEGPAMLIPRLMERDLIGEAADEAVEILVWPAQHSLSDLPADTRDLGRDLQEERKKMASQGIRFAPLLVGDHDVTIRYAEVLRYDSPILVLLESFRLYQACVAAVEEREMARLGDEMLAGGRLRILAPNVEKGS